MLSNKQHINRIVKYSIVLAIVSILPLNSSLASDTRKFRVGAGIGSSVVIKRTVANENSSIEKTNIPFLYAGYAINDYLSTEMMYRDLGTRKVTVTDNNTNETTISLLTLSDLSLLIAFNLPLSKLLYRAKLLPIADQDSFNLFFKMGTTITNVQYGIKQESELIPACASYLPLICYFSIGAEYTIVEHYFLRYEYGASIFDTQRNLSDNRKYQFSSNISNIVRMHSISLGYRF